MSKHLFSNSGASGGQAKSKEAFGVIIILAMSSYIKERVHWSRNGHTEKGQVATIFVLVTSYLLYLIVEIKCAYYILRLYHMNMSNNYV